MRNWGDSERPGHPFNPDGRPYGSSALTLLIKRARYHGEQSELARDEYNMISEDISAQVRETHPHLDDSGHLMVVKGIKERDLLLEQAGKRQAFHAAECARLDARFQAELTYKRLLDEQRREMISLLTGKA
jgi:hypothetical protein